MKLTGTTSPRFIFDMTDQANMSLEESASASEPSTAMVSKIPWSDLLIIAVIGLLIQAVWLFRLEQPSYMDAYYYAGNGERLADGHGFTEMVIWQYLDDPDGLPTPSHTYWMPLPSILAAIGFTVRGDFLGEQLVFWLLGGLLPLLSFAVSILLSGERWQAWVAALFTATGSFYGAFFSQPSTFSPFAWAGAACLLMLGIVGASQLEPIGSSRIMQLAQNRPWIFWFMAGIFAGFAHLTRADGILLLVIALAIWTVALISLRRTAQKVNDSGQSHKVSFKKSGVNLVLLVSGYLIIMGGWFVRNWTVLNRPLSTVGFQSMLLTTYDDLFAYGRTINLSGYLAWGWENILLSKLESLWVGIQTLIAVPGVVFLVPFVIIALAKYCKIPGKRALLRPVVWYAMALILSMSILFTFPGMRGAVFHSSSALWPWSTALAAAGIGFAVDWTASRLPHWDPEKAKRRFSILFIMLALFLGFYVSQSRAESSQDPAVYLQIGEKLPAGSIVMAGNAPAVNYHTDLPSLSVPNEPVSVVIEAANRYGVTHLLLDKDAPLPLQDIYQGVASDPRIRLIEAFGDTKLYQFVEGLE